MDHPEAVRTREDLAAFIDHLRADLAANPDSWENADLPSFLEAMSAYVRDMPGLGKSLPWAIKLNGVDWQMFAVALAGARVYE
ncbi:MAG: DUF7660 family protein [Fimbriiglobus sp.]